MMKHAIMALAAACCFGAFAAQNATAQQFEGKVTMATESRNMRDTVNWFFQNGNTAIEISRGGNTSRIILNAKDSLSYFLVPQRKMCLAVSRNQPHPAEMAAASNPPVRTGKTEVIQGYPCDEWIETDSNSKNVTDMWLTKGLGTFPLMLNGPMGGRMFHYSAAYDAIIKQGLFPLRAVEKNGEGKEISRGEVIQIDKKHLDASLFTVPADYQKMHLPAGGPMGRPDMPMGGPPHQGE